MGRLFSAEPKLHETKAKEYLLHGVGRRLGILTRSIQNIFTLFPPERAERLALETLIDVEINLHAFALNISGLFDNLAWTFVIENNLFGNPKDGKLSKINVGLFNAKTQAHFPETLREYLNSEDIMNWHSVYLKNYRDALAHRIPLYIPPFALDDDEQARYLVLQDQMRDLDLRVRENWSVYDQLHEQQSRIGIPSLVFMHSSDENRPAIIHQQILVDYVTVDELLTVFCDTVWAIPSNRVS
jgi:hypothetical protein